MNDTVYPILTAWFGTLRNRAVIFFRSAVDRNSLEDREFNDVILDRDKHSDDFYIGYLHGILQASMDKGDKFVEFENSATGDYLVLNMSNLH